MAERAFPSTSVVITYAELRRGVEAVLVKGQREIEEARRPSLPTKNVPRNVSP